MGAVSSGQMRSLEAQAMQQGWTEETLMDLAGEQLGRALACFFPIPGTAIAYIGKGHNAGDALIALRVLRDHYGWQIFVRQAYSEEDLTFLTRKKHAALGIVNPLTVAPSGQEMARPLLLIDGLLGIGAHGPLRSTLTELAKEINVLREQAGALVASVDLPSGVDPDSGEVYPGAVTADVTFMIGAAKEGLLRGNTATATGALALVPLTPLHHQGEASVELISPQTCHFAKAPRPFDFHKGQAGRVSLIAGSENYPGAAVMAATGALRGGAGLITLWVPHAIRDSVARKCPPEIIVRGMKRPQEAVELQYDAMVIGCGIGPIPPELLNDWRELLSRATGPTVLDADALNFIANNELHDQLAAHHIITPHPGEFARLAPDLKHLPREEIVRSFTNRHPATLLLKGSRTIVCQGAGPLWINSTGSPGMATGGQGDLLSGVIAAALAGGLPPVEAACHAAWLCGRAAERALLQPEISEQSLTPSDVAHHLGGAFKDWRCSLR